MLHLLDDAGVAEGLAKDVGAFYSRCDAIRYSDGLNDAPSDLIGEAKRLILELEDAPCPALVR